jgi:hypothetical protein
MVHIQHTAVHPRPLESLIASAKRITSQQIRRTGWSGSQSWQEDAWEMFDLVGELRFLATTLSLRMGKARLYVGQLPEDRTEDPEPVEDPDLIGILDAVGGTASARSQLISRLGINLFVAGDGWLAGIPRVMIPASLRVLPGEDAGEQEVSPETSPDQMLITTRPAGPAGTVDPDPHVTELLRPEGMPVEALEWRMLSVDEVTLSGTGEVQLRLGLSSEEILVCRPEDVFLIRVWRSHPRRWWEADSPVRASLSVLRQLVGLTMHASAEIDSRLAGAGILLVPSSASRALKTSMGLPEDSDSDPFTESLIEAMLTPIRDRSSASATVPLVATVPDEAVELFKHLSFAVPLDEHAAERVDQSLRRLALGLDAPPETLLGSGGMNHWGAWLVQDDVVSTHLEPPLSLICDALTTQYLWPVLLEQGMAPEKVREYVVWYDVSNLVVRPTASADALELHSRGVISDSAVRRVTGFEDMDASTGGGVDSLPIEVTLALDLVAKSPSLLSTPGLPQVVAQLRAVLEGRVPDILDEDLIPTKPAPSPSAGSDVIPTDDQGGDVDEGEDQPSSAPAGPLPQPTPPRQPGPSDE